MTMRRQILISTFFILLSLCLFVMSIYIALSAMNHSFDSSVNVGYEVEGRVVLQIVNNEGSNITYDNNKVVYDEDSGLFRIDGVVPEISLLARSSNMQVNNLDELTNSSNQEFYYFSTLKEVGTNSDESILKSQTRYYVSTEEDPIWYTVPETPIAVYSTFLTPNNMTGTQEETEGESVVVISHAVTSLSSSAFMGNSQIESVVIPNSVQSIESEVNTSTGVEEGAFLNCSNLTNVILPSSVENISAEAFSGSGEVSNATYDNANYLGNEANPYLILTSGLSSEISTINIHSDCEIIQSYAFNNYDNLTSVNLPSKIREIGVYAFSDCNKLESVVFSGTSLTEIKDNVFSDSGISSIIIPEGVEEIGYESFYACINLTEITLPSTLKVIDGSFGRCVKLESVTIPSSVTNIGRYAFNGCVKLEEVVLSSGVIVIDDEAFANCRRLTGIILPNTVTTIGTFAFDNCSSMNYVVIPESAVNIENNAFMSCNSLTIYSETESELASWVDNWNPDSRPVYYFGDWEYDNGIPTHATISLGFVDNIGSDIEETNFEIVYNPSNRNEFRIDGIVPISNGQGGITNLSSLQNNLDQEFYFFSTDETWTLEENSQRYYASTEANPIWYQVPEERDVTLYSVFLTPNCFTGTQEDIGSNTDIVISHQVTTIPYNAFSTEMEGVNITSVIIPNSVTRIDSKYDETGEYGGAFAMCMSLTNAIIPSSIEYVGGMAFMMCTGLATNIYDSGKYIGVGENPYALLIGLTDYTISSIDIHDECISIQGGAFADMITGQSCQNLTNISIPSKVKNIGYGVFVYMQNLSSVTFEKNSELEEIGVMAFAISGIESIILPKSVKDIGYQAFASCGNLTSLTIEEGNKYYSSKGNCLIELSTGTLVQGFKNSVIPNDGSIKIIGIDAFNSNDEFTGDLIIPEGVTTIESGAFYFCDGLNGTLTLPSTLKFIGDSAFQHCSGLTGDLVIPEGVISIGESAFDGCGKLTGNFDLPNTLTSIGRYAFRDCDNLTGKLVIPNGITHINDYTFSGCLGITSVVIPESIISIDNNAFEYCYKLIEVYNLSALEIIVGSSDNGRVAGNALNVYTLLEGTTKLDYREDGYLMYEDNENNLYYLVGYVGSDAELTLPTTSYNYEIYEHAFEGNINITSVIISSSVTSIGDYAFEECSNLINVTIGENVGRIATWAFRSCYKLVEVYNLSSLEITPGSSTYGSVAEYALSVYTSLLEESRLNYREDGYVMYEDSVNSLYYLVDYTGSDVNLALPTTSYNYEIYKNVFRNRNIISLNIPSCVTNIGISAFSSCDRLVSVTFEENSQLVSIGDYAFNDCWSLANIDIPDNVISIGEYAFYRCDELKSLTLGDKVAIIDYYAFFQCTSLKSIVFPSSLISIGGSAFQNTSLTSIVIPDSVTSIGGDAFRNTSLTSIVIPDSVTSIGGDAFSYCSELTIYCEAVSQPSGWDSDWNYDGRPVYWAGEWSLVDGVPVPNSSGGDDADGN